MNNGCNFANHLAKFTGQTVTIFTTSGGESGGGFSGVLMSVNSDYVRLLVKIGSAPSCAIYNSCSQDNGAMHDPCHGGMPNKHYNQGSVVDIPISRIASFVHNSI
ncbi:hypothetical protein H2684_12070 [Clostridium sp. cel8]|uniref:hypothetical protein n=1 Tax=unclassified Clostridium TaxID=2614128 RepID=UPI0015F6A112|nr:hypothetical protein [Clostridium sp. cel8]MBA5852017.1 hypothetical protein [Clostridium sp. cel8]